MPGARLAAGKRRPVEHIQRRKQRCVSVADVVMHDAFDVAKTHRERGLSALQRLAWTFLVKAQHRRVVRRIQLPCRLR